MRMLRRISIENLIRRLSDSLMHSSAGNNFHISQLIHMPGLCPKKILALEKVQYI